MAAGAVLNISRKKLIEALGGDCKLYFSLLKLWFRRKLTKEEFDYESRKLLKSESIPLHNEFLLAILGKCQSWTSTHVNKETNSSTHSICKDKLKKGKVKKKSRLIRATFEHRFQPINPLHCVPPVVAKESYESGTVSFCTRESTLPDKVMIHGRMFVSAWDCGLDAVDDEAVDLVLTAVECHLKNVLMAIFSRRHAYKLREGRFKYAVGTRLPNPYLIGSMHLSDPTTESLATDVGESGDHVPSLKWSSDRAEVAAMQAFSCSRIGGPVLSPVSLYDVHETLQVQRQLVSSHGVYAVNMERIAARLWHPDHEHLEYDQQHSSDVRQ